MWRAVGQGLRPLHGPKNSAVAVCFNLQQGSALYPLGFLQVILDKNPRLKTVVNKVGQGLRAAQCTLFTSAVASGLSHAPSVQPTRRSQSICS